MERLLVGLLRTKRTGKRLFIIFLWSVIGLKFSNLGKASTEWLWANVVSLAINGVAGFVANVAGHFIVALLR